MSGMDVAALLVSLAAAVLAGLSAVYTKSQAHWTRIGAEETKAANHLNRTPQIEVWSEGKIVRGVELYLRSDTDLSILLVEVHPSSSGMERHLDTGYLSSLYMDQDGLHQPELLSDGRTLKIENMRAGEHLWISGIPGPGDVHTILASFRLLATAANGDSWVLSRSLTIELDLGPQIW